MSTYHNLCSPDVAEMGITAYVAEGADLAEGADRANGADVTNVANLAKIGNLALHKNTLFFFYCFCHQEFKNVTSDGLYGLRKDGCANITI